MENKANSDIKFLDKMLFHTKDIKAVIKPKSREAKLFLRGIFSNKNTLDSLYKFNSKETIEKLQYVLVQDESEDFLNNYVVALIDYLGSEEFSLTACKEVLNNLLDGIFTAPFFKESLLIAVKHKTIKNLRPIIWLILECTTNGKTGSEHRKNKIVKDLVDALKDQTPNSKLHKVLCNIIHTDKLLYESKLSFSEIESLPGNRHNNDNIDFRDINIMPTTQEITCKKPPFLPKSTNLINDTNYLDKHFRLLREDFVGVIRDELTLLILSKDEKKSNSQIQERLSRRLAHRTYNVKKIGFFPGTDNISCIRIEFKQIQLKHNEEKIEKKEKKKDPKKELKKYWEEKKHSLDRESVVCLLTDAETPLLIGFGIIKRREINEISSEESPCIGVKICDDVSLKQILRYIGDEAPKIKIVQLSAFFPAYVNTLLSLQDMKKIPFSDQIISNKPEETNNQPEYFKNSVAEIVDNLFARIIQCDDDEIDLSEIFPDKTIKPDRVQIQAVINSLDTKISLIHGPPGTGITTILFTYFYYLGKSYCGALIAKILYNYTKETILCVCYTNHAVDQFLNDLLEVGIPGSTFKRIGRSPKIDKNIQDLETENEKQKSKDNFSLSSKRALDRLFRTQKGFIQEIHRIENKLRELHENKDFEIIQEYSPDLIESFTPLDSEMVGKHGKLLKPHDLWKNWIKGEELPHLEVKSDEEGFWKMSLKQRNEKINGWKEEVYENLFKDINECLVNHEHYSNMINEIRYQNDIVELKTKRIIGCTSTAAAKYSDLIKSTNPSIVILEEAGELLESQVISCLPEKLKQLILIGDHQQLRPKVNNYDLTVESAKGFDLNLSLFERLILNKAVPCVTLELQHRMSPAISRIVKGLSYPNLRDAEKVKKYPPLKGMQDNVIFINHDHYEDSAHDNDNAMTHINKHEVKFSIEIVKYLLMQGYEPEKLVILTPYLGQLFEITSEMKHDRDLEAIINDMDKADLLKILGLPTENSPKRKKKKNIQVSTIDNYQGNQNDIIIISLVRNNPNKNVGFLCEVERVNVLLSRARHGMIIIGNRDNFVNSKKAKKIWQTVFALLESNIYTGLPVQCIRHPKNTSVIETIESFNELPYGCSNNCSFELKCGHHCPKKCHPDSVDHKLICSERITEKCEFGHEFTYNCGKELVCKECKKAEAERKKKEKKLAEAKRRKEESELRKKQKQEELKIENQILEQEEKIAKDIIDIKMNAEMTENLKKKMPERIKKYQEKKVKEVEEFERVAEEKNIEEKYTCAICKDEDLTLWDVILCEKNHSCCRECFEQYIISNCDIKHLEELDRNSGAISCFEKKCEYKFNHTKIVKNLRSEENIEDYLQAVNKIYEKKLAKVFDDEYKQKLEKEIENFQKMSENEKKISVAKKEIIETIFTLKCPRCKKAFIDFEGCMAVNCTCNCGFCGYCLQDCGNDAHDHIPGCKLPNTLGHQAEMFLPHQKFQKFQNERRDYLLILQLDKMDPIIAREVAHALEREMKDLNLIKSMNKYLRK